jgi:hypothetical protein
VPCPAVTSGLNDSLVVLWVFPLLQNQMRVRAGDAIGEGPMWGEALRVLSLWASLRIPNKEEIERASRPPCRFWRIDDQQLEV